jgi:hypothetical protein
LVIQQSGGVERTVDIWDKPFYTLGRFGADVLLHGEGASRLHAVIYHNEAGETCLIDLGSRHGTHIHDFRLEAHWPHPWKEGVIVTFGPPGKRDRAWLVTAGKLPIRGARTSATEKILNVATRVADTSSNKNCASNAIGSRSAHHPAQKTVMEPDNERLQAKTVPVTIELSPRLVQSAEQRRLPDLAGITRSHVSEAPAKRQRISFGDLIASREDVAPVLPITRSAKKASELWTHSPSHDDL